jgi:hypothetical protein
MFDHIVSKIAAFFGAERARGVQGLSGWRHAAVPRRA